MGHQFALESGAMSINFDLWVILKGGRKENFLLQISCNKPGFNRAKNRYLLAINYKFLVVTFQSEYGENRAHRAEKI